MTTILIKKKDTAGAPAAGDLTNAAGGTEIAVNTATKRIYTKDAAGNVVELGTNASASTVADLTVTTSTTLSYGTANQVQYLNASKLLVGSANMTFDGTTLTVAGFSNTGNTILGNASADTVTVNGTITSNLIFTDATYDIGASGATRPRNLYLSNAVTTGSYADIGSYAKFFTVTATGGNVDSGVAYFARNSNLGGTLQYGFLAAHTATSASTTGVCGFATGFGTAAAAFTTSNVYGFLANNVTKGSGSTITNQYGLFVDDQTSGNSNYGAYLAVTSGSNKWNVYASGSAPNYFAGYVAVGANSNRNGSGINLQINDSAPILTLQTTSASAQPGAMLQLIGAGPGSANYNWSIGGNWATAGCLEFIRSTSAGGTAFTFVGGQMNSAGAMNIGGGAAFQSGYTFTVYGGATQNLNSIALDGTNTNGGGNGAISMFGRYTAGSSAQFERARIQAWNSDDSYASSNKQFLLFYTKSGNSSTSATPQAAVSHFGDFYVGSASLVSSTPRTNTNGSYQNLFVGSAGALYSGTSSGFGVSLSANAFQEAGGGQVRMVAGYAARFDCRADDASFVWYQAGTNSAGTSVSFGTYMLLDGNSRLTVGGDSSYTASSYRMTVVPYSALGIYSNGAAHSLIQGGNELNLAYNNSSGTDLYFNYRAVYSYSAMRLMNGGSSYVAAYALSFNPTSDYRMKENLVPYQEAALPKIMGMNFFSYNFINDGQNRRYLGGLAHDLKAQEDLLVHGEKDAVDEDGDIDPQAVDPVAWCALLSKAMQELKNEFDAYKLAHQ